MVDLGRLAKRAKGVADKHGDKIADAVNKATDAVDQRTKGKYKDKLTKVDELARKLDKTSREPGAPGPGPAPNAEGAGPGQEPKAGGPGQEPNAGGSGSGQGS